MPDGARSPHPNALPNYENAVIPRLKLEGYALNPIHEAADPSGHHGRDKARFFKSALGFDQSNWEVLAQLIMDELPYHEAISKPDSEWGAPYDVDLPILGVNGKIAMVRTAWLVRRGTDYPSLITLYPSRRSS